MKKLLLLLVLSLGISLPLGAATFFWPSYIYDVYQRIQSLNTERAQLQQLREIAGLLKGESMLSFNDLDLSFDSPSGSGFQESVHALSFESSRIVEEYEELFPSQESWEELSYQEQVEYYRSWNEELYQARENALNAQAHVVDYRAQVESLMQVGDPKMVPLLARMLQVLGTISYQLSDITDVITTGYRVAITQGAVDSQSQQIHEGLPYSDISIDVEAFKERNTPSTPMPNEAFRMDGTNPFVE